MKEIIRRTISLLLSFIMVLGVMPMNLLAGTSLSVNGNNTSSSAGTTGTGGNGTNTGGYTTHSFNATGYKIQLAFLKLPDEVYSEEDSTERKKKVTNKWNALVQGDLKGNTDSVLTYIGAPVYLTTQGIYSENEGRLPEQKTSRGYVHSDLQYGIGDKTDKGYIRSKAEITKINLSTPSLVSGKYRMNPDLPIYISETGKRADGQVEERSLIRDYFLCKDKNEKGEETYYARENLASLVNFIANNQNNAIKIIQNKILDNYQ